jgi:hypothetical protein
LTLTVAGKKTAFAVGPQASPIELTFDADKKVTDIHFDTDVPRIVAIDARELYFKLIGPSVAPA